MQTTPQQPPASRLRVRSPHSGQGGFSLLEVLISVALVSTVVLALALGFLTMVRANQRTAELQQLDQAVGNYTESLKAIEYLPCDDPSAPGDATQYNATYEGWLEAWVPQDSDPTSPKGDIDLEVISVEYWDPDAREFDAACTGGDPGSQRLTVEVRIPERGHVRAAQIVKRAR